MTSSIPIQIIDASEFDAIHERVDEELPTTKTDEYDTWGRLDDAVWAVAEKYGRVGSESGVDFYHSLDWYHPFTDTFALMTAKGISGSSLREFQAAVAKHHPKTCFLMIGDPDGSVCGLDILITGESIYVSWTDSDTATCRQHLQRLRISLD